MTDSQIDLWINIGVAVSVVSLVAWFGVKVFKARRSMKKIQPTEEERKLANRVRNMEGQ